MTATIKRPYIPVAGPPATLLLTVLTVATAAPTVFILQSQTPPTWVTTATFAVLLATVLLIPRMNRRAPAATAGRRTFSLVAIGAAIIVPLALIYPAVAVPGMNWLMALAVGIQIVLVIAAATIGGHQRHSSD